MSAGLFLLAAVYKPKEPDPPYSDSVGMDDNTEPISSRDEESLLNVERSVYGTNTKTGTGEAGCPSTMPLKPFAELLSLLTDPIFLGFLLSGGVAGGIGFMVPFCFIQVRSHFNNPN